MSRPTKVPVEFLTREIYERVIDQTIAAVKPEFVQEGIDESVVDELRKLWDDKLKETGAVGVPGELAAALVDREEPTRAARPATHPAAQPQSLTRIQPSMQPYQAMHGQGAPVLGVGLSANPQFMYRYMMGHPAPGNAAGVTPQIMAQPAMPPLFQSQTHLGIPPQQLHQQQYQQQYQQQQFQHQQRFTSGGLGAPPALFTGIPPAAPPTVGGKRHLDQNADDAAPPPAKQQATIPQRDGTADDAPGASGGDAEEAELGEEDDLADVDDHEEIDEDAVKNVVLGTFEKVHRSKAKWRLNLTNCVANVNGRDYLLKKLVGELNFS